MKGFVRIAASSMVGLLVLAAPAMAQEGRALIEFSGSFGAGLVTMGAAYGIGKLAASAYESMARQPEIAGQVCEFARTPLYMHQRRIDDGSAQRRCRPVIDREENGESPRFCG